LVELGQRREDGRKDGIRGRTFFQDRRKEFRDWNEKAGGSTLRRKSDKVGQTRGRKGEMTLLTYQGRTRRTHSANTNPPAFEMENKTKPKEKRPELKKEESPAATRTKFHFQGRPQFTTEKTPSARRSSFLP